MARAAVGEGSIGDGLLQWGHERLSLAEGHLDVVRDAVVTVRERKWRFCVLHLAQARAVELTAYSFGRSTPVSWPKPYSAATFWMGVSPYLAESNQ